MRRLIAVLAVLPSLAAAQERPSQHPYRAPILAEGAESHYRFTLPAAAYRGVARAEEGAELRVPHAAALVATGFGVFVLAGGFALDEAALARAGLTKREARERVLGLAGLPTLRRLSGRGRRATPA